MSSLPARAGVDEGSPLPSLQHPLLARVVPRGGALAGPPPLMVTGTRDTLWPQGEVLVRRAAAAGAEVTYQEERDLLHVYPMLPIPEARWALEQVAPWLR